MTKEEGVRLYYKAQNDYAAAASEKQRCQTKLDEWTGALNSYIRQRDAKTQEINLLQSELDKEYENKRITKQATSAVEGSTRTDSTMRTTLSGSVSAEDVQNVNASRDNASSQQAQLLAFTIALINEWESEKSIKESEKRNLDERITECDRSIRTYKDRVLAAIISMRNAQQSMDDYRKYLYV